MSLGPYRLDIVESGRFGLDGGAMFGIIPKPLWEKKLPPDEQNRIPMALRTLLIRGAGRTILVDTGMGDKWGDKQRAQFRLEHPPGPLVPALAALGVEPEDVTDVLLTHLHFDHAGGATTRRGGALVPTFPHARYHVQRGNLDYARQAGPKDRGSYLPENFEPLVDAGVLCLMDGPTEFLGGIETLLSHGHTPFQQHVRVFDGDRSLIYVADMIPTCHHIHLPWVMAYDLEPARTIAEKETMLAQVVAEGWVLFFEHDPQVAAGTVVKTEKGYELGQPVTWNHADP